MNCLRLLRLAQRQQFQVLRATSVRCLSNHPIRFMETQNMWREKDGVSKRWQLIYKAPMDTAIKYASTYLTLSTAMVAASSMYYGAFVFELADLSKPVVVGDDVIIANTAVECFIYLGAFIALNIAVKTLVSKYVLRLYQDGDEYLAIFRGHFFNTISTHKFHLRDFKKLSPTFVVSWGDARFDLGNKHGILLENYFKTPEHFHYLLEKKNVDRPDFD
uniref:Transmembrane protein 186 n=1 Tax=Heliothis virescens TaxID=7102 RepID=A0A2A4K7W1_HELVI